MHRFSNKKVHAASSRSHPDSITVNSTEIESTIIPRFRRASIPQLLTQTIISGTLLRKKKSQDFHKDDDLVEQNSEEILPTGNTINIHIKIGKNNRAGKNRLQLIKHDFTSWYRRWTKKRTENPFLKSYINYFECNYGSGIGSFFVFTRWVIQMNFFLSLIWFAMVVFPTVITFEYSSISLELTFWNIFNGEGGVSETWLFYGGFLEIIGGGYHVAFIYLLLILITYFGSLFIIMDRLGESHFLNSGTFSTRYKFSSILFSSWNHSITSSYAAENLSKGIASVLKDNFSEDRVMAQSETRNRREANNILCLRILAWLITIVFIGGSCTSIVFMVINLTFSDSKDFSSTYLPSIIFSLLNVVIPKIVTVLPEYLEHYASVKTELIITGSRIFILRMANLCAFFAATLYGKLSDASAVCTGVVIGQEFYKLIFVDTVVHAIVEILMTVAEYKWTNEKLEFNISSAVLVLIYRQGLIWAGTIACPLMPLFGFLSNLVFFFMFYNIIKNTCKPPMKRWDQSGDTAFLMGFLLTTLLLIIVPVSIAIGSNYLGQSPVAGKTCGPFGDMKPTEAYGRFREQCTIGTANHILKWLASDSVLVPLFFLLLSLLNYQRNLLEGEKQHRLLLEARAVM